MMNGRKMEMARKEKIRQTELEAISQATPSISQSSRVLGNMKENIEVVERLYNYQKMHKELTFAAAKQNQRLKLEQKLKVKRVTKAFNRTKLK